MEQHKSKKNAVPTQTTNSIKVIDGDEKLYKEYVILQWIGKGLNMVYEVQNEKTLQKAALKEIKLFEDTEYEAFKNEIALLEKMELNPHPSIIQYKGYFITLDQRSEYNIFRNGYILMEKGITCLEKFIKKRSSNKQFFNEEEMLRFIDKMIQGHLYLQNVGIAHRDVKPENILITSLDPIDFKICDVGVGTDTSKDRNKTKTRTLIGTISFLSSELFQVYKASKYFTQYNPYKSDVYSLGLCILYTATFKKLTVNERMDKDDRSYENQIKDWIKEAKNRFPRIPKLSKLLKKMLSTKECDRPDFIEVEQLLKDLDIFKLEDVNAKLSMDIIEITQQMELDSIRQLEEIRPYFLKINISGETLKEDVLKKLGQDLKKQVYLKRLWIKLELSGLKEKNIQLLMQSMENLVNLEELNLQFWNNSLMDNGAKGLLKSLQSNGQIKRLNIVMSVNQVTNAFMNSFNPDFFKHFKQLQELTLDLGLNNINDPDSLQSFSDGLQTQQNLISLNLNFEGNKIRRGIKIVSRSLINIKNLEVLSLNLSDNEIMDQGLFDFSEIFLKNNLKLKKLKLNLWKNSIRDRSLKIFSDNIKNNINLELLNINLSNNCFEDKGLSQFAENLNQLQKLNSLSLNISKNQLHNIELSELIGAVLNIPTLNQLLLILDYIGVSGEPFLQLDSQMKRLVVLSNLTLSVKQMDLKLIHIQSLATGLKSLEILSSLSLDFEATNLQDEGAIILADAIGQIPLITNLSLSLQESRIGDIAIEHLLSAFNQMDNLSDLYLDIERNILSKRTIALINKFIIDLKQKKYIQLHQNITINIRQ